MLFLCTDNACRSQMAERWAHRLKGDIIEPYSAGVEVHELDSRAVHVMTEAGVDISAHQSKQLNQLHSIKFDYVITVCDNVQERCPIFPGATKVLHVGFADPPRLTKRAQNEQEALDHYRRVRDEIRGL